VSGHLWEADPLDPGAEQCTTCGEPNAREIPTRETNRERNHDIPDFDREGAGESFDAASLAKEAEQWGAIDGKDIVIPDAGKMGQCAACGKDPCDCGFAGDAKPIPPRVPCDPHEWWRTIDGGEACKECGIVRPEASADPREHRTLDACVNGHTWGSNPLIASEHCAVCRMSRFPQRESGGTSRETVRDRDNERNAWEQIIELARTGLLDPTPKTSKDIVAQLVIVAMSRILASVQMDMLRASLK
jgi:hypothetical protein